MDKQLQALIDKNSRDYTTVRLSNTEMEQLMLMKVGDVFFHVNLQHSGVPTRESKTKKALAVEILKNGKEASKKEYAPKLRKNKIVVLKLLQCDTSIPIASLNSKNSQYKASQFILESPKGILDSLFARYYKVRDLTRKDILNMNCYIRKFKILRFLNL